jgi:hypothetical protein
MDNAKSKRYYFPGLISLAVIPILVIFFYSNRDNKQVQASTIPIYIGDTNRLKELNIFAKYDHAIPPKRNYYEIELTGNNLADKKQLELAASKIKTIISTNDATTGLHFKFADNAEYWTFLKAVDVLRSNGAKTYLNMTTDMWFYHFPQEPKKQARIF